MNLRQAAAALVVSYHTVRSQQASLYRKLGVSERGEAITRARQQGLL
jgi:LuxR family maltose regulon positive regulatory protein